MMIGALWAGATTIAAPAVRLLLRWRAARGKEIASRLPERRGVDTTPRPPGRLVWLHAASVGETMSILPVLASLATLDPELSMLLTTGTVTSSRLLAERLPAMGLAEHVTHRFAPLDVPVWARRFLDHWRPDAAGFVESELWPNMLAACHGRGIPLMLINARMSARSHAAWSRVPGAARAVLGKFTRIHARGEEDASRLRSLGATDVRVAGDLKRASGDLPVAAAALRDFSERLSGRPVFLAASTHPGEELVIAAAHDALHRLHPGLLTIIAPRHPERGPELAEMLGAPRRGDGGMPPEEGIWIADTLGELGLWYRLCHVCFIGRSLIAPGGGQNPLEPAQLGRAIAVGPFTSNFTEAIEMLRGADAVRVVADADGLVAFVHAMLDNPAARRRMGEAAAASVRMADTPILETARALLDLASAGDRSGFARLPGQTAADLPVRPFVPVPPYGHGRMIGDTRRRVSDQDA